MKNDVSKVRGYFSCLRKEMWDVCSVELVYFVKDLSPNFIIMNSTEKSPVVIVESDNIAVNDATPVDTDFFF